MALIIVAGASGQQAAVVYEAAILSGVTVLGFATIDDAKPPNIFDCSWMGSVGDIVTAQTARRNEFVVACGSNEERRRHSETLLKEGATLQSIRHPAAIISPSARIGPGSAILAGAIIGPRTALGTAVIINHGASIDHDCDVGDYANISPGARFAGCVQAEPGVFVGLNASILQGLRLGEGAIIGAGAVVTRSVSPRATVIGAPARPVGRAEPQKDSVAMK